MQIAIIGGGISGLATYLQLKKHFTQSHSQSQERLDDLAITIFESHSLDPQKQNHDSKKTNDSETPRSSNLPSVGAAYGLAANGMASLRRLDPGIHDKVLKNSFPTPRFQMKTKQGWTLGAINCVVDPQSGGEKGESEDEGGVAGPETCCMVLREVVLEALYARVPADAVRIRRVVEVVDGEDVAVVKFEDGEKERFDLVVGADGIWSRARKAISGDENGPEHRHLATLSGFTPTAHLHSTAPTTGPLPYPQSHTTMIFGNNGFFAYTPCTVAASTTSITASHIRGDAALPPGDLTLWWARSAHAEADVEVAKRDLEKRLASWQDDNIPRILQHSVKTGLMPTYVLPRQKTWAGRRVVLVGDAAHALPTSSGQGVSQSLEDAEALAMLFAHHFSSSISVDESDSSRISEKLREVLKQYMAVRKAHVERILDAGNRGGDASRDLNIVAEYALYAFFWVMLKFFSWFLTKEIEDYDVVKEVEKVVK